MIYIRSILTHLFGTFLLITILTGCIGGTSPSSVYYVFTPAEQLQHQSYKKVLKIEVGVGPVTLPGFLDRPEIVTRQGENQLIVNEFHRWGDSLDAQINYVMAENLSARLETVNVIIYPWQRPLAPKYQIYIDFRQFDGKMGGSVTLKAIWRLVDTADDKRLITQQSLIVVPTSNNSFESYVAAQNDALEKLSNEIAKVLINTLDN